MIGKLMAQEEMTETEEVLESWDFAAMAAHGISLVRRLSGMVGTKVSLKSIGVKECDFTILAQKALQDGCIKTSPVIPDQAAVIDIYQKAWEAKNDGTG